MFKNIFFDFDGVIINSHDAQVKALSESYQMVVGDGMPPYEEFFRLSGDSLKNIFLQLGLPLEMIPLYQKISIDNIEFIKLHHGMNELLQQLNEMQLICALCTGKDRSRTIEILKHFDMKKYFKIIVCSDDVANPKPHPESLLLIMKKINALRSKTVMVGDGINDILSAKSAGISSIAVTWGDTPKETLQKYNPEYFAKNAEGLANILF